MHRLARFCNYVGLLRAMLYTLMIILGGAAFFSSGGMQTTGLMIFPTLIAPALVPMLVFVIPLDVVMCKIMMSDKGATERRRYNNVIKLDLTFLVVLLAVWFPFYQRLLTL